MFRRGGFISMVLTGAWILLGTRTVQAQNPVDLTIFRDEDSLTIFVPGPQPVSLQGFRLKGATSDGEFNKRLEDFPSFQGLDFNNIPTPICFRLERFDSRSPVPDACPPGQTLVQLRNDADVFWYDGVTHQDRLLLVLNGADQIGMCAAGHSECFVTYGTPEAVSARRLARQGVTRNADWSPYSETFQGVEMMLVPAGCFVMGATDEFVDYAVSLGSSPDFSTEQPTHRVCFDEPFWIDRTEVTNAQYGSSGEFSGDNHPRETVTWTEAQDFCVSRGARLPTSAEWEYAARGPESWWFPWGNNFDGSKLVWNRSASEGPAPVGSKPEGASWVGALDMSGNVGEYVSDWQDWDYYATLQDDVVNPTGPRFPQQSEGDQHLVRGGPGDCESELCLYTAWRAGWGTHRSGESFIGFRCARSY